VNWCDRRVGSGDSRSRRVEMDSSDSRVRQVAEILRRQQFCSVADVMKLRNTPFHYSKRYLGDTL
jgi:hypothetical protein